MSVVGRTLEAVEESDPGLETSLGMRTGLSSCIFLMVTLLQNSQTRSDQAIQHKLNAIADGLADLMAYIEHNGARRNLEEDLVDSRAAVGLEEHESTTHNAAR